MTARKGMDNLPNEHEKIHSMTAEDAADKNRYETLFDEFMDVIEFQLVKYRDGWGLADRQGANLGEIESDRFVDAAGIIDRLDIYIHDYFTADVQEALGGHADADLSQLLAEAREKMAPEELEHYRFELEVLDMICNHPDEIDLEKCLFTVEEDEKK